MTLPTTLLALALAVTPAAEIDTTPDAAVAARTSVHETVPTSALMLREGAGAMALLAPAPLSARLLTEAASMDEEDALIQARGRRGIPLMASGAALLVAGLLIGGDVGTLVALGGAVIGAYGVFLYF